MRCLNCRKNDIANTEEICPKCGVYFSILLRDVLPKNTLLRDNSYQIDSPLGRGGFGITYRAMHIKLDQLVAIKEFYLQDYTLRNTSNNNLIIPTNQQEIFQRNLERFKREGKILAKLRHPNIVQVTDLFEANGTAYLVMELLDGCTLRDELDTQTSCTLSPEHVKSLIEKIVSALDVVHQAGIYHLDIKPDNILLTKEKRIVLVDFGAAKQTVGGKSQSSRSFTEDYAAPEVMSRKEVGTESDIFELGMVIYELLTGKRPPNAMERLLEGQQTWHAEGILSPWKELIEQALILKKENRPKSIKQWWEQHHQSKTPVSPSPKSEPKSEPKSVINDVVEEIFVQFGHTAKITSIIYSPDGKYFLSASCDETVKLWDIASGRELNTFQGHTGIVNSIAFSPDGKHFLSASWDSTIKLWDINAMKEVKSFSDRTLGINQVAYSPDGKTFLSAGVETSIKLWDLTTGKKLTSFVDHVYSVNSVAFSPDGKFFLSASADKIINLWDLANYKEIKSFLGHTDEVNSVAFSPDGKFFLSASADRTINLWDLATKKKLTFFSGHTDAVNSVAYSPNGKYFLSASNDETVKLWDIATSKELKSFRGHTGRVTSVAYHPNGKYFLSAGSDKTIKLWDIDSSQMFWAFKNHTHNNMENSIKVLQKSNIKELAASFLDQSLEAPINSILTKNGKYILQQKKDKCFLLEAKTGKEILQIVSFQDEEWVVLTSDGYYDTSSKGEAYLSVRLQNNKVVNINEHYRSIYHRLDIIANRLKM